MDFITSLKSELIAVADKERAAKMSAYMRDQFSFYGVMATPRKEALRNVYQNLGLPTDAIGLAKELFALDERELNVCGQELLFKAKKQWTSNSIKDFEWFITTRSWWDTVDYIASNVVGEFCKKHDEFIWKPVITEWAGSNNMWLQRTAILYQLKYRKNTDTHWLSQVIEMHAHQTEFFIKKAIGWALREYSKTDAVWVKDFVTSHDLQALSVKEGMRLI